MAIRGCQPRVAAAPPPHARPRPVRRLGSKKTRRPAEAPPPPPAGQSCRAPSGLVGGASSRTSPGRRAVQRPPRLRQLFGAPTQPEVPTMQPAAPVKGDPGS